MSTAVSTSMHQIEATEATFSGSWSLAPEAMPTGSTLVRGLMFAVPLSLALWVGILAAVRAVL